MHPPHLPVLVAYYLIRYAIGFACPEAKSHEESRGCFFDKKIFKEDIKLSMRAGKICDPCHDVIGMVIDGPTYTSFVDLVEYLSLKANERGVKPTGVPKPRVFIGSSSEGLRAAELLQLNLDYSAECSIWSQGVFGLSRNTLEVLVDRAGDFDYAVLVLKRFASSGDVVGSVLAGWAA